MEKLQAKKDGEDFFYLSERNSALPGLTRQSINQEDGCPDQVRA
jgi:hypothetical protein